MLTREQIIEHLKMLHQHEPAYAEKAHRWYSAMLPWFELPSWIELTDGFKAAVKGMA